MAFPFMTGFYSKDYLLELALIPNNLTSSFAYFITLLAAILTAFYSVRLLILTFITKPNFSRPLLFLILEPSYFMTISLII
jgi:NADH:ubiquinone oxidoreductase subunit 5 (subunit L)/multisubunit Na+/H+ antiporter MnhA subunit